MQESVNTGGLKRFVYSNQKPRMDLEEEKRIELAYKKAKERKRRGKIIKLSIITLAIIIAILIFIFFKK